MLYGAAGVAHDRGGPKSGRGEPAGQFYVLAASVMTLLIGSGAMFLVVVALKPIAAEFSWPRQVPSLAFSLQFLGAGFGGFFMGRVLDRYGMGPPALVAALTIPCGAILLSRFDAAWQLYVIYGLLIGFFGTGALAAPAMANIARWYIRRRGMAVGMVAGGQALAGAPEAVGRPRHQRERCSSASRTGAKSRRCTLEWPRRRSASRCSAVA